ncbi:MAG: tyrosine-type recombinase/integrase [Candidatus Acidiferrum sp.]
MARPRYQCGSLWIRGKKRKRYVIRWREDVAKPDGSVVRIRRAETIGFVSQMKRQQALEILQSRVSALSQQRRQPKVTVTLSDFVRAEWKPNAALALKKSSMRIYSYQLEKHILPTLGEVPVRDLSVAHIEACLSRLKQKGHATSTLRSVRATFATVLRSAVKRGHVERNPAHGVVIRDDDSKKEWRFYSADQVRMLLNALTEPCASVVAIAVLTGLRIGEILALRWKRIDLLGATLEVAENYSSGEFVSPKTKSSRRVIPISSALRRVLENQRACLNPASPDELVFQTPTGTPLSDKNLYNRELAPACDRIGQPRVSWHSFRHTHQTLLHDSGASLKTSQELLGHSDLEATLNVYTHTVSDSQRNAVERVAGVLFGVSDSVGLNSDSPATPGRRPN